MLCIKLELYNNLAPIMMQDYLMKSYSIKHQGFLYLGIVNYIVMSNWKCDQQWTEGKRTSKRFVNRNLAPIGDR